MTTLQPLTPGALQTLAPLMMRLPTFLFVCAVFLQLFGVCCANLPIPGTDRADQLRAHGLDLLAPSEQVVAAFDRTYKLTVTMDDSSHLLLDTVAAVPLNLAFAGVLLSIGNWVIGGLPRRRKNTHPARATALSRAGL